MTDTTVSMLRRLADQLDHLPDDAIVDVEALTRWGSALVHDREAGIHVEVRFSLEDLPDE